MKVDISNFDIEDFEDEIVLVNFQTGIYYSIKENGLPLFRLLIEGIAPSSITNFITQTYGEKVGEQFQSFVSLLIVEGILVQTETTSNTTIEIAGINLNLDANFVFEKFDDISGLIKLDPIHEVTMNGWPNKKA